MSDRPVIFAGLGILLIAGTSPFWWAAASGAPAEPPDLPLPEGHCVESLEFMRDSHMDLLITWRDSVVREGNRTYTAKDGSTYDMSLTNTCLTCHGSQEKFCTKCHDYVGITVHCWDCHQDTGEVTR